jgi:hypothetical protein
MRRLAARAGIAVLAITGTVLTGCAATATATEVKTDATEVKTTATTTGPPHSAIAQFGRWEVAGTFQREGGPIQPGGKNPPIQPLRGVVTFRDSKGHSVNVAVGVSGKFSVALQTGTYTVTGRSPQVEQQNANGTVSDPPCSAPMTTVIRPRTLNHVVVTCIVP